MQYPSIQGKTYTLFGDSVSTREYYRTIGSLADKILEGNNIQVVLGILRKYSSGKRYLKRLVSGAKPGSLISLCLNSVYETLKPYTRATKEHLRNLPVRKYCWDRRLATSEEQYHLYMLEIELTNRLNREGFLRADRRISLQPYCLQDFSVKCRASASSLDYQCKFCSKDCYQHYASKILKDNNIEPYIWMGARISRAARDTRAAGQILGILGIACIPELVMGMRKCLKYGIPVVGLPLNANRCIRWFGKFHPNSVDLEELEMLVKTGKV